MGRYTIHCPQSHESLSLILNKAHSATLPQTRLSLAISLTPNLSLNRISLNLVPNHPHLIQTRPHVYSQSLSLDRALNPVPNQTQMLNNAKQKTSTNPRFQRDIKRESHLWQRQWIRWARVFFLLSNTVFLIWDLGFWFGGFGPPPIFSLFPFSVHWFASLLILCKLGFGIWSMESKRASCEISFGLSGFGRPAWWLNSEEVTQSHTFFFVFVLMPIWEFFEILQLLTNYLCYCSKKNGALV